MKSEWIHFLIDPVTGQELTLDKDTLSGKYPVTNGIPSFIAASAQDSKSVESFEYEWNKFGFLYGKEGWEKDIVLPLLGNLDFFKDKTVVDAGAGSGSQSLWMAQSGAKLVFSLELSDSIYKRMKQTISGYEDKIFPIQCDISKPPIGIKVDIVYCMNVIQHTADIKDTFHSLVSLMNHNSFFIFNVYERKLGTNIIEFLRAFTVHIPFDLLYIMSLFAALLLYPIAIAKTVIFKKFNTIPNMHNFKETWINIYDLLGPHHFQHYMSREEVEDMIKKEGLKIIKSGRFGYLLGF